MISNQTADPIDEDSVRLIAEKVLSGEGVDEAEISIAFIGEDEMRKINSKYRDKDEVTDVLSFPHDGVGLEGTGITFIGEVLICPSVVRDATLNRVLIHGILHLLEYDHELSEKEEIRMREREDLYL